MELVTCTSEKGQSRLKYAGLKATAHPIQEGISAKQC